ncbi:MAG: phenylalanine--tRNA ligase subunit beta [Pseudomonadota bacterium]
MNILTSYNWIKEHLDTKLSAEEFAKLTTMSGNSVERMDMLKDRFAKMVIGEIERVKVHPNADKLRIVETKIGSVVVEIVCGGENLVEGQKVVVALPGALVKWHGEDTWVELKETEIRGVKSHGMICAPNELGFEKLQGGQLEIWDVTQLTDAKPGTSVAEALDLDDVIFDIEVTSNRPDCQSIIGQAREGSAVTGGAFVWKPSEVPSGSSVQYSVTVKEEELCPNYSAVVIDGVKVGPSPWWLQKKLLFAGHRPINNIVDITNYILHEYGQPLHTFDADKLGGDEIIVRLAKKGEKFVALDESEHKLDDSMLVIADKKRPVAIAGVMGGLETGTTEETKRIVIECATFDPVSVRQTSRVLNLRSDSSSLFEKGLSTESTGPALARAIELVLELSGGTVASQVIVKQVKDYESLVFPFDPKKANALMGIEMEEKKQVDILERLGFELKKSGSTYEATVPYWRDHDIEDPVDFVEEIARVYGYKNFPSKLPSGTLPSNPENTGLVWQRQVKEILKGTGLTEAYSYSFVSPKQLADYEISEKSAVKIANPLSEDQQFMRPSLVPSMLSVIEANQGRVSSGELFELAPVYLSKKNDIPDQKFSLVIAMFEKDGSEAFTKAKGVMERLFRQVGLQVKLDRGQVNENLWHKGRSATIHVDKEIVGTIGQISARVKSVFGLDTDVVLVELDFEALLSHMSLAKTYTPIPLYPSVKRDIAFVVSQRAEYLAIEKTMKNISELLSDIDLFDVYRGEGVGEDKKSLAIHLSFSASDRTLKSGEADEEMEKIRLMLEKDFDAIMRS